MHDSRFTADFTTTPLPHTHSATGEMIQEAQMPDSRCQHHSDGLDPDGPWAAPDENGFGVAPLFVESALGYGPMIDSATAKRFIQESGNRKVRADAIVAMAIQPSSTRRKKSTPVP